jgi:hypothetical protein
MPESVSYQGLRWYHAISNGFTWIVSACYYRGFLNLRDITKAMTSFEGLVRAIFVCGVVIFSVSKWWGF